MTIPAARRRSRPRPSWSVPPARRSDDLATTITNGSVLTVDGKTITFSTAQTTSTTDSSATSRSASVPAAHSRCSRAERDRRHHRYGHRLDRLRRQARAQHRHEPGSGDRRLGQRAHRARPHCRHHRPRPAPAQRPDADDRRDRRRHRHQHHLRRRRRAGFHAERAQRGAGGQQPAGDDRHDRSSSTSSTSNDAASSTIGAIGGTAAASRPALLRPDRAAPAADPDSQAHARQTWSRSTTTCWRKSTPRRRTLPSTASTC